MRFAYNNLFDDYDLIVSSETGNYPGTNIQDSRLSKVWHTTALTSQTATVDCGTGGAQPTVAALLATNFSSGGTYKLQGSSSSGFSSSTELTLTRIDADFVGAFSTGLTSKRYWRFLIKDTGSTDTYMSVGRAWMGTYLQSSQLGMEFQEEKLDSSEYEISYSGQHFGDEGEERRSYSIKIPYVDSTSKTALETFFSAVKQAYSFITVFSSTDMTKIKPLYGFKAGNYRFKHIYNYQWDCSFKLEESK